MNSMPKFALCLSVLCSSSLSFAASQPNPEMKAVLDELASLGGKPIENLSPDEARKQPSPADAVKSLMKKRNMTADMKTVMTEDIMIDGAAGKIAARVYRPLSRSSNRPLVVYFHGGGFVIATNDTYDATPRSLAAMTDAVFLSVEYRKAPENKFPSAHDDAYAAYSWALKNATSLGADPTRIAVAGESAGANLALNVAIRAREQGLPLPAHELLVYPVAGNDMNSPSYKEEADAKPLNKNMMAWFVKNYMKNPAEAMDSRINLQGAVLKGLNSATIITAQIDPLRSEGKGLAQKLEEQGVKVNYKNFDGVAHEFFGMAAVVTEARKAQEMASEDLKNAFKIKTVTGR